MSTAAHRASADMEAVIEAILFVANDPVPRAKLLEVFAEREQAAADAAVDKVVARYSSGDVGGIVIDEVAGGLRLVSRPDLHGYLRRFFEASGKNKLSMPALETLAIVAYRQPVTAPEIAELRGVSSQGVLKTLLERRLIRIAGRKEVVGKPFLYASTREFLMHFGLRSLKELPPLEDFEEMFGGDPEATSEQGPVDSAEQASLEAAALEAQDEAMGAEREAAAEVQDRLENEAAELPLDAEPPTASDAPAPGELQVASDEDRQADGEEKSADHDPTVDHDLAADQDDLEESRDGA